MQRKGIINQSRFTFKFLLTGNGNVGKTSMVRRLCRNDFIDDPETTIGVEFMTHMLDIDGNQVKLQIWDTAGQEKYRSVGKAYYRNAIGVLLVFSLSDHSSFASISTWLKDVRQYCHPKAKIILVGNKSDLISGRDVTTDEAQQFASSNDLLYIESSAKDGVNVAECFISISRLIYRGVVSNEIQLTQPVVEDVEMSSDPEIKKEGCKC